MVDTGNEDPATLRALLLEERKAHAQTAEQLRQAALERDEAKAKLQAFIKRYFGKSSEKIDPAQLALALESLEADKAIEHAPAPAAPKPKKERRERGPSDKRARRMEDLPILERVVLEVPPQELTGPDGRALVKIREEITEEVDYRPGQLFRRQIIRPVMASPTHACAPRLAELPARVIPGSQVGTGLIAHVIISKFMDHLPVYRQAQMLERLGPCFSRQAMLQWIEHGTDLLKPVHAELLKSIKGGGYCQIDETPIDVLDPELPGQARSSWLWAFHDPNQREVCFEFHRNRSHLPAKTFLEDFQGTAQVDGYEAYQTALRALPPEVAAKIVIAGCMAHCRRHMVRALEAGDERAAPFLVHIRELYKIEENLRLAEPAERERTRNDRSVGILAQMQVALKVSLVDPAILPKSALGKAVAYALDRWDELCRFAQPGFGHINIDNNPVERSIRPTKLGAKNWLFVGHPDAGIRPAVIYSVLGTCKLQGINPWAYLNWALPRLAGATNKTAAAFTPQGFLAASA